MPEATPAGITKVHMVDATGVTVVGTGGGAATIADGADVTQGAKADLVWDGLTASPSLVSILKKVATSGASAGLTDAQLRASAVPVSGTFWQATQPVSAASLPLPTGASTEATLALLQVAGGTAIGALKSQLASAVAATSAPSYTDGTINPLSQTLAGALRVGGTVTATGPLTDTQLRASAVPVSGAFFQATQPVSLGTVKAASTLAAATDTALVVTQSPMRADASTLCVTGTAAVNTALTVTLPAPAAGLFHYITSIQVQKLYAVVGVAAGTGVIITTTNLPGTPAFTTEQLASAAGTVATVVNLTPTTPLKSAVAATATTIVAPVQLQTIWRINVTYYTAP